MNNIVSVGLDTHKNSISICATRPYYGPGEDEILFEKRIPAKKSDLLNAHEYQKQARFLFSLMNTN